MAGGLIGGLISAAEIELAMANSPLVEAEIIERAEAAATYWRAIARVGTREHTLKSGYVERPGDYRDSIQVTFSHKGGIPSARIEAKDYKRAWIEYGSIHNDEDAPRQKTADAFGARVPDDN